MARRRSRTKTAFLSSASELRRGFTIPSVKRIKTALRKKSKLFLIQLVVSMFSKLTKTEKIRMLIRIDGRKGRKTTKRRTKRRRATRRRAKTRRRKAKRRTRRARTKRSKASIQAERLRNLKKARAAKRRR